MNWNVNSIAKDNFHRLKLLEAQTSLFNYDLVSLCETSLNDTVDLPDSFLQDYISISSNKPANTRRGGVGLYYKNTLPIKRIRIRIISFFLTETYNTNKKLIIRR